MQTQAIVLAGGKGERLMPLTASRPKALVWVKDRPLLRYHLEWLAREGVTDAVITCGYMADAVQDYLASCPIAGIRIFFSREERPLGRGGAMRRAFDVLPYPNDQTIVSQSDTISDMPLREAFLTHSQSSALITLLLVPYRSRYGVVDISQDGEVIGFREKPRLPYWANTGTFVVSPDFFSFLPVVGDEDTSLQILAMQRRVRAFCSGCYWRSVDMHKDIAEAEADLALPALPHEDIFVPSCPP